MKVPIDLNEMMSKELLQLARACCREVSERNIPTWRVRQT